MDNHPYNTWKNGKKKLKKIIFPNDYELFVDMDKKNY